MTHKSPRVDGTTLVPSLWFTLPIETHVYNNTFGPPSEENSTDVVPSSTTISTLDSTEAGKNVPLVVPRYVEGKTSYLDMLQYVCFTHYILSLLYNIYTR